VSTSPIGAARQDRQFSDERSDELRAAMVDDLVTYRSDLGLSLSDEVVAALRIVPRHLFAPGTGLAEAYADEAVVIKRDAGGAALSSVSAPSVIAAMLDQLSVQPGDRVLEIGSGGYNAALCRELTGPAGQVTTIDIDPEVTRRARTYLDAAGFPDVHTVCADGEYGAPRFAPYDRIIVTVGAADIPPAWIDQLAIDGRLVVPLRLHALTRSIAFEHDAHHTGRLTSHSSEVCGFVPIQGAGVHAEHHITVHQRGDERVLLRTDVNLPSDAVRLRNVLDGPRTEEWPGVTVGACEPFDDMDLWLAATSPGFCVLTATDAAVDTGVVTPSWRGGTPASIHRGTIAYRTIRPLSDSTGRYELGACAHGPDAPVAAERFADQMLIWHRDHRGGPGPRFTVQPAGTATDRRSAGVVIDRPHTRITISWP
jgi:protein-L-isoaspartate(D-aspartate) O-methyltransferase